MQHSQALDGRSTLEVKGRQAQMHVGLLQGLWGAVMGWRPLG